MKPEDLRIYQQYFSDWKDNVFIKFVLEKLIERVPIGQRVEMLKFFEVMLKSKSDDDWAREIVPDYAGFLTPDDYFNGREERRKNVRQNIIDRMKELPHLIAYHEMIASAAKEEDNISQMQRSLSSQEKPSTWLPILYQKLLERGFIDGQVVSLENFEALMQGKGGVLQWQGTLNDLTRLLLKLQEYGKIYEDRIEKIQVQYKVKRKDSTTEKGGYRVVSKKGLQDSMSKVRNQKSKGSIYKPSLTP